MLSGSDLNYAYVRELEPKAAAKLQEASSPPPPLPSSQPPPPPPQPQPERIPIPAPVGAPTGMESSLLTSDEKLYLLSSELKRQRDLLHQQQSQPGYFDKLWNKKKDVMRLLMITLIFMLALSLHWLTKHYLKAHLEASLLTPTKEFLLRAAYPVLILFALWNLRVFNK